MPLHVDEEEVLPGLPLDGTRLDGSQVDGVAGEGLEQPKERTAAILAGASALTYIFVWSTLGVVGLLAAAYLGYDWLRFRIKNGVRF